MAAFAKSWRGDEVARTNWACPQLGVGPWSVRPDLPQIVAVKRPTTNMTHAPLMVPRAAPA